MSHCLTVSLSLTSPTLSLSDSQPLCASASVFLQFAEINLGNPTRYCTYSDYWGKSECPPGGNDAYSSCEPIGSDPYGGVISFDNILKSWMAVFMTITLDTWTELQVIPPLLHFILLSLPCLPAVSHAAVSHSSVSRAAVSSSSMCCLLFSDVLSPLLRCAVSSSPISLLLLTAHC